MIFKAKISFIIYFKRSLIIISNLFFCFCAYSQQNNNWAFGLNEGISFNKNHPSLINTSICRDTNNKNIAANQCISFSNCQGNLVVYGSGSQLWNKNHKPMKNGSFKEISSYYKSLILPQPKNDRYLFYIYQWASGVSSGCVNTKLMYAVIDLYSDGGNGKVIFKDQLLDTGYGYYGSGSNNLTYALHSNTKDIWIIYGKNSNQAISFLLTDTGLIRQAILSNNVYSGNNCEKYISSSAFNSRFRSIDGSLTGLFKMTGDWTHLIVTGIDSTTTKLGCSLLYDFDRSSGKLIFSKVLLKFEDIPKSNFNNDALYYSNFFQCEVSSNDSLIYFVSWTQKLKTKYPEVLIQLSEIWQINRFTLDKRVIKKLQNELYGLQIGPDNKLYLSAHYRYPNKGTISEIVYINSPNKIGNSSGLNFLFTNSSPVYNFPSSFRPFHKLYYTSNLASNPCADTALFDLHVDGQFRKLTINYGDGDSIVLYPPFKASYHLKHKYKVVGKYYFMVKGLNPQCDYYTHAGDSFNVYAPPSRFYSQTDFQSGCLNGKINLKDSFANTSYATYKWQGMDSDTFTPFPKEALLSKNIERMKKKDTIFSILTLRNLYCPYPKIYRDSFEIIFHPTPQTKFSLSTDSSCNFDSINNKLHYTGCSPFVFTYKDSTEDLVSASISEASNNLLYGPNATHVFNLVSGNYLFIVNDTNSYGCTSTDSFYVHSKITPTISLALNDTSFCFKDHLLKLKIFANNISDSSSINVDWGDGKVNLARNGDSLMKHYTKAWNYSLKLVARSIEDCVSEMDTLVSIHPSVNSGFTINPPSACLSGNNFEFITTDSAIHNWYYGDGSNGNINHKMYSNHGAYKVKHIISNSSGCIDSSEQFLEVFEMPKALLSITVNKACLNDNLFSIKTNSIYSITDSLFQNINWGDGQSNSFKGNKETTYSYSSPGQYRMVLINRTNKNCIDSNEFIAKVYPNPTSDISVKGICLGDSTTLLSVENGTAEVVNWQWQSKEFNLTTEKAELKHRFSKPGEYKVKVLAISDNGCFAIDSTNLEIWNLPKAEFSYVHFNHASSNIPFLFTDNSLNSDGRLWIFSSGDTSLLKTLQYEFSDTGFYKITLIASLAGKCFDSASILLPVYRSFEFYFPNVFSPDRNQINESFGLSPSQIFMVKEYRMRIFNRWGEKVFDSDNSSIHWTGVGAEQGVYIYKTEIRDIYNVFHEIKGRVELLR